MAEAVSRMTGKAAVCIGTLGPGLANLAGAMMCAKVENSPVIFLGGQRARITEQRVRRGRIQFVQQARLLEPSVKYCASIEYAEQTDEIIREGLRRALSGTPGPVYIEYPAHVIQAELDVPPPLPPHATASPARRRARHNDRRGGGGRPHGPAAHPARRARRPHHPGRRRRSRRSPTRWPARSSRPPAAPRTSPGSRTARSLTASPRRRSTRWCSPTCAWPSAPSSASRSTTGADGTGRRTRPSRTWILIEQDPAAIGVNRPVDVPLVGDLRAIVPQLTEALKDTPRTPSPELAGWIEEDATRLAELAETGPRGHVTGTSRTPDRRGDPGLPRGRHHGPRRRGHHHLRLDLLAGQAARRDVEPELRPPGHRACPTPSAPRWRTAGAGR